MNRKKTIKEGLEDLSHLKGKSIRMCFRSLSGENLEHIPQEKKYEESDGITCLVFSSQEAVTFYPNSEEFSITFDYLDAHLAEGFVKVPTNEYWSTRLENPIEDVKLLHSEYSSEPYGLNIVLENGRSVKLVYVSESEFEFDALVLR
jgi:hypothetical protein